MKTFRTAIILLALVMAGCATHRIDWNSRVGNYTLDQAIRDFGPPDKQARLSDGDLVAEWVSHYASSGGNAVVGMGYYGYPGGVSVIQTPTHYYDDRLRLTFGTNSVLKAWTKNY